MAQCLWAFVPSHVWTEPAEPPVPTPSTQLRHATGHPSSRPPETWALKRGSPRLTGNCRPPGQQSQGDCLKRSHQSATPERKDGVLQRKLSLYTHFWKTLFRSAREAGSRHHCYTQERPCETRGHGGSRAGTAARGGHAGGPSLPGERPATVWEQTLANVDRRYAACSQNT